ncbi:OsmC family protein [Sphingomonas sp. UYP23]
MALHTASISWTRGDEAFVDNRYSRRHEWRFDGGAVVPASSSPHVVRLPFSDPAAVDPEEAFLAALSSCHMLWFLGLAAQQGVLIERYDDVPEAQLVKDDAGREWFAEVRLAPHVVISGKPLQDGGVEDLHHRAHEACFLANSVRSRIQIDGTWTFEAG